MSLTINFFVSYIDHLGAADELIIFDNLHTFKLNGFDFEINEDEDPTKRIKLISYPFTKGAEFGLKGI
jgi:DNA mismatch repair protein PMS2